jgi:hypothetical protein
MIPGESYADRKLLTAANGSTIDVDARAFRKSSIFLRRMISSMFMRVNSKCAHQARPPSGWFWWRSAVGK